MEDLQLVWLKVHIHKLFINNFIRLKVLFVKTTIISQS